MPATILSEINAPDLCLGWGGGLELMEEVGGKYELCVLRHKKKNARHKGLSA